MPALERGDFLSRAVARPSVALVNPADELLGVAVDLLEVVIRQLAPLNLGLAFDLVPLAFELIRVHDAASSLLACVLHTCRARPVPAHTTPACVDGTVEADQKWVATVRSPRHGAADLGDRTRRTLRLSAQSSHD